MNERRWTLEPLTFLQDFQVLPEDVAHEGWRAGQKVLLAHGAHVAAAHAKVLQHDAFQRELLDGPVEPARHVRLGPQARICKRANGAFFFLNQMIIIQQSLGNSEPTD